MSNPPRPEDTVTRELTERLYQKLDALMTAGATTTIRTMAEVLASEVTSLTSPASPSPWQGIENAPKGSWPDGPNDTRDPAYAEPPHVWLYLEDGQRCVGYFDAYYAEGGHGFDGGSSWVEAFSGERVRPTHWMPLPPPPVSSVPSEGAP